MAIDNLLRIYSILQKCGTSVVGCHFWHKDVCIIWVEEIGVSNLIG